MSELPKKMIADLAHNAGIFRLAVGQIAAGYGAISDADLISMLNDDDANPVKSFLEISDQLHRTQAAILTCIALMNDRQRHIHKTLRKSN